MARLTPLTTATLAASALSLSMNTMAHEVPGHHAPNSYLDASISATWRSKGMVNRNDFWRVPGALMGGHALPKEQGLEVDEVLLTFGHRFDHDMYVILGVAGHGGGEHQDIEVEHALLGYQCCGHERPLLAEIGRSKPAFSPELARHDHQRHFSERPLAVDVFFGGHVHDEMARLWWHQPQGFSAGVELLRGSAFPATPGQGGGAGSIFVSQYWQTDSVTVTAGAWSFFARADQRPDARYQDGHSHGPASLQPPPDVRFSGDTTLHGFHLDLNWAFLPGWHMGLNGEWMAMRADGQISEANRRADIDSTHQGYWLQPSIGRGNHTVALRYDHLQLDNHIRGAAASSLAEDAGLINPGEDPTRLTLGWRWQARQHVALRLEASRDESTLERRQRINLGVVWQQRLAPSMAQTHQH